MDAAVPNQEDEGATVRVPTVAATVLAEYFDALEALDGFADVAANLRATVIGNGVFSEAAIRTALFGDPE